MLRCIEHPAAHLIAELDPMGILSLTIQRPACKNALDLPLYLQLQQAMEDADQCQAVQVLILRGNQQDFSAGNDIRSFLQLGELPAAGQAGCTPPFMFLKALAQFSKPCIAAVRGVCIGVANTLLLHCDWVYAEKSAVFQMPFVALGLSPESAASLLLIQRAGYHRAAALLLSAQKYNAETALKARVINEIVDDCDAKAYAQALQLVQLPTASLIASKKLMKHNMAQILQCIDHEAEIVMQRAASVEMVEAVSALLQKRSPDFRQFDA